MSEEHHEELGTEEAGVVEPDVAPDEGAEEGETIAGTEVDDSQVGDQTAVDWTGDPSFRQYQSARDRREAQLAQQLMTAQDQVRTLAAHKAELEDRMMEGVEPEEQAKYYRSKMRQMQDNVALWQDTIAYEQKLAGRARQFCQNMGVDPADPRIGWTYDGQGRPIINEDTTMQVMENIAMIAREGSQGAATTAKKKTSDVARKAKQEGLKEAGVTKVSSATGPSKKSLASQYQKERAALRNTGDMWKLVQLKKKYRKQGLDV